MNLQECTPTLSMRFWSKVNKGPSCWIWAGSVAPNGYGKMSVRSNHTMTVHRVSWVLAGRVLKSGMCLDHLCRNRLCVNPDHLELVTHRENVLRGVSSPAGNARKTMCSRGHSLVSGEHVKIDTSEGRTRRRCLLCRKITNAAYAKTRVRASRAKREAH